MIFTERNLELTYPRDIKHDKMIIVLDWLLEFRFSTIDLLSQLIDSNAVNSNRFFNNLIDNKVIYPFKNVHTRNFRYVMLTTTGISFLKEKGRDVSRAYTRVQGLGKYSQIIHDLCVQYSVLNISEKGNYTEVIWDKNINNEDHPEKPDALMKKDNGSIIAIEYERWRKEDKRIFMSYKKHADALLAGRHSGVIFIHETDSDVQHYKKLFDQKCWPMYSRSTKSTKIRKSGEEFEPGKVKNLKQCFAFTKSSISI